MKECCANCRYFEAWGEMRDDGTGWCEWDGDVIDMDPEDMTCFSFEEE